jgi:hypothetical protein
MEGWHYRPAAEFRQHRHRAGITSCLMYRWLDEKKLTRVNRLEVWSAPESR